MNPAEAAEEAPSDPDTDAFYRTGRETGHITLISLTVFAIFVLFELSLPRRFWVKCE